jgi:hypothetical protein
MMTIKRMLLAAAMVGSSSVGLLLTTENASAVIYCTYIGYPHGCVARPGVRLVARPATVGAVTAPRPGNSNGGVNRVGVRR